MDSQRFAVFGCAHEHIVRIHDSDVIVVDAARRLPEAKAHRGHTFDGFVEIFGEARLPIEPIGNVVKDLYILSEHVEDGFHISIIECISESLCQRLDVLYAHGDISLLFLI
jgi:hypothetical protein